MLMYSVLRCREDSIRVNERDGRLSGLRFCFFFIQFNIEKITELRREKPVAGL